MSNNSGISSIQLGCNKLTQLNPFDFPRFLLFASTFEKKIMWDEINFHFCGVQNTPYGV